MRLNEYIFEQGIEQNGNISDVVYPNAETLLAGKQGFHIFNAESGNAEQMIHIGTRHNAGHLFRSEIATERERMTVCLVSGDEIVCREFGGVVCPLQIHAIFERECSGVESGSDKGGAVAQQAIDDADVHFMAVLTNCFIAIDIPMAIYEVIRVTVVPFAFCDDFFEIKFPRFRKQGEKFFRHILFGGEMMAMRLLFKKREGRCLVDSCRITF